MKRRIKVMAYYKSTGIWAGSRQIKINKIVKNIDAELERELYVWQAFYNAQFNKYPFDFDWDAFNQDGRDIVAKVQQVAHRLVQLCNAALQRRQRIAFTLFRMAQAYLFINQRFQFRRATDRYRLMLTPVVA